MPVMKTQEIQCLECKDVLLAVMGERKTLVCSCEAVKVNVHSNYISTESNSDNYELGEIIMKTIIQSTQIQRIC